MKRFFYTHLPLGLRTWFLFSVLKRCPLCGAATTPGVQRWVSVESGHAWVNACLKCHTDYVREIKRKERQRLESKRSQWTTPVQV